MKYTFVPLVILKIVFARGLGLQKYYGFSTTPTRTKIKGLSRKLDQFNSWPITDLKKWIRTAKRMILKVASRKTPNNILTYTTLAGNLNTTTTDPIQYIVKLSSHQTINNRKSTTINNYYHSLSTSTKKNQRLYQNNK